MSRMLSFGWYSPGTFSSLSALPYVSFIEFAYGVQDNQISGAPKWIDSDRFDIQAKTEKYVAEALLKESHAQLDIAYPYMIQQLLVDRFGLIVRHESKELPVYALVVAKNGPKLYEAKPDDTYPNGFKNSNGEGHPGIMLMKVGELTFQGLPIVHLVDWLSRQSDLTDRVVLDETELKGIYDFTLKWTPGSPTANRIQARRRSRV